MTTVAEDSVASDSYSFPNSAPPGGALHDALAQMFDLPSRRQLLAAGLRPGHRVLEVGAGGGKLANWMARQVGSTGYVLATDIDTRHIHPGERVEVLEHDIRTEPVSDNGYGWNIIHARALLAHLPDRENILARLVDALAPGGVLVVEEMQADWPGSVLHTPDEAAYAAFAAYGQAITTVLMSHGLDPTWVGRVHGRMKVLGLEDVRTHGWQRSWTGGTGVCLLALAGSALLRDQLLAASMPPEHLDVIGRLAGDSQFEQMAPLLRSTIGYKPAGVVA